jgi:hypothetical protein
VGRTCARSNRAFQNAAATLKRWLKTNRPDIVAAAQTLENSRLDLKALEKTDPITAGVLQRKLALQMAETMGELTDPAVSDRIRRTLTEDADPTLEHEIPTHPQTESEFIVSRKPHITTTQPMRPSRAADNVTRVIERVWSTGRVDYQCAIEGCPVTSSNSRSISQHFGSAHTMAAKQHLTDISDTSEKSPPEPEPTDFMTVTDDVVPGTVNADNYDVVINADVLNDAEIISAVQNLVSRPLRQQIDTLTGDVERVTKERDEARDHLSKIQQDLDALRSLVAGIGNL